jgi:hypothetical protein
MPAVYGDMLLAFPELMQKHEVFNMEPLTGAGYGQRYNTRKTEGWWEWRKSGKAEIEGQSNIPDHQATYFMKDRYMGKKVAVDKNDYIEKDGKMFRIIMADDFTREGGYYKCLMQFVTGVTDRQVSNRNVERAVKRDYL